MGVPEGLQRGPKRPKTAFFGHKRIWSLQTGGTVWNKGGTSQGTSTVMHWNSFGGQGGPPDPIMAPQWPFWAILGPFGVLLGPPNGTPDPRNGSNASLGMCPDLFHLYSTLFRQSGATTPPYGYKMTILGHLGPFWGPSGAPIAPPDQRNGSIALPRMCPDLFHLYSTLFCQFGATRPAYGSKMTILGRLGPFWGTLGAPQRPP